MTTSTSLSLPTPEPVASPETEAFWEGTRTGQLLLPRCVGCSYVGWYPREFCVRCGGDEIEWMPSSGRGRVYSFTILRQALGEYRDCAPFCLAYVELEEGPRIVTNVIGARSLDDIHIDAAVHVSFARTGSGLGLPRFELL